MAQGGPETDYARGRGGIPLPDLIAQAEAPPADPSQGLGPDMGMPRLMQDDTAGYAPTQAQLRQEDVNMNPVQPMDVGGKTDIANNATGTRPDMGAPAGDRGYRRPLQRAPWNERYRYTQEDFYGSGNPNITFTDPRGVQLYVPQAGKLPMSIWASQMQAAQGQLAQTRKAMADLMESSKVPETAPPFQRDFSRLVLGAQDRFIKGLASQYGGDENLAMQEIATDGSEANRQWRTMNADAEAVGQFVKYKWQDAQKWIQESIDADIENYPPIREHARELMYGIGSLRGQDGTTGDFSKAAKATIVLDRDMNLSKYVREMVLPNAGAYYKQVEREVQEGINRGQRVLKTTLTEEVDKEFYDRIANEAIKLAPGLSKEYVMDYVKHVIPERRKDSETLQYQNLPQPSGASGSGANTSAGTRVGMRVRPAPQQQPSGITLQEESLFLPAREKVGDRWVPVKEADVYSTERGAQMKMLNPELGYERGRGYVIRGRKVDTSVINQLSDNERDLYQKWGTEPPEPTDADYAEWQQMISKLQKTVEKTSPEVSVPFKFNQQFGQDYYGDSDGDAIFASQLRMSPDEVRSYLSTPEGTRELLVKSGLRKPAAKGASSSQGAKKGTMTGASGL